MANQKRSEIRKEQILRAAERIFARKGFQESTISDVAREAGVSDATIYEYFPSKEELLFSIPEEVTSAGKDTLKFHLNYVRGAANKIRSIIYHYLFFYENHPDYASVSMLILKQNRKFLETDVYKNVREMSRFILEVIEEGIACGEFEPATNPHLIRSVILGTIEHLVARWALLGAPEDLVQFVDPLTDLIIEGIQKKSAGESWNLRVSLAPQGKTQSGQRLSGAKTKKK